MDSEYARFVKLGGVWIVCIVRRQRVKVGDFVQVSRSNGATVLIVVDEILSRVKNEKGVPVTMARIAKPVPIVSTKKADARAIILSRRVRPAEWVGSDDSDPPPLTEDDRCLMPVFAEASAEWAS